MPEYDLLFFSWRKSTECEAPGAESDHSIPPAGPRQRRVAPSLRGNLSGEPTAALDSQRGRQFMELFTRVAHETQVVVIVVTHDHRSLDVFDTHYEMEDGRLRLTKRSPQFANVS